MATDKTPAGLVQGTLDMLILKTLALEPLHGFGIGVRIEQISGGVFKVNAGSLFPAWKDHLFVGGHATNDLVRLELNGEKIVAEERLLTDRKERIRDVRQGPDGALYLLTDAANGKLLKLVPKDARP